MKARNAISAIGGFFDVIGSAMAVSRAIESGRQPTSADLRVLGIDAKQFRKIGH